MRIIFSIICTVLSTGIGTEGNAVLKDFSGSVRKKRDELNDRWDWGYVDETEPPDKLSYLRSTSKPDARACDPYNPPVPSFWSPGRRISEAKCDEYIWQMRLRDDKQKRIQECNEYHYSQRDPSLPPPQHAVGGHITLPGEYPHMGALGWKASGGTWVFKCGSSLISPKFLLTAAHCSRTSRNDLSVADPVPKIVRLGDKNIADVFSNYQFPKDENISRIIVHPKYAPPKKYNDIAIIELAREIEFTMYIQPACLWTKFDTSSLRGNVTLTGWGVVETTNLRTSPELQAAEVDIIESGVCSDLLHRWCSRVWCGVQDSQICAGKLAGGVDSCQGDSGGPLQVKIPLNITGQGSLNYLIGVTSFGIGCALPNKPGIYTRVSSYIDWIEKTVWS